MSSFRILAKKNFKSFPSVCVNIYNSWNAQYYDCISSWDLHKFPTPVLDESYLCDSSNKDEIASNIKSRKGVGDINRVLDLVNKLSNVCSGDVKDVRSCLIEEMLKIPNRTHPDVLKYGESPTTVHVLGDKRSFDFKPNTFQNIANSLRLLRNDVSNFTGHRSYFFLSQLAELESALIKYTLIKLIGRGFQIVSVPDILHRSTIERCGMESSGKRSQVYSLSAKHHGNDKCLSGTAEMALAAYLTNKTLLENTLPLRLAAVSRCYRAETSRTSEERGIYRVHQFTKVEMFGVSNPQKSNELLDEFRMFQEEHFLSLGLHLQVLDMPANELGAQAYRKYDVEAWLPGKGMWAEVSSCSDCTDYQSRRLGILSGDKYVHTVNGTACAVPRLIIALFETHQQADGSVCIPTPLLPFMKNVAVINKDSTNNIPILNTIKKQKRKS